MKRHLIVFSLILFLCSAPLWIAFIPFLSSNQAIHNTSSNSKNQLENQIGIYNSNLKRQLRSSKNGEIETDTARVGIPSKSTKLDFATALRKEAAEQNVFGVLNFANSTDILEDSLIMDIDSLGISYDIHLR